MVLELSVFEFMADDHDQPPSEGTIGKIGKPKEIRKTPERRYTPKEIVAKLRQVDVLVGQDKQLGEAVKSIGVTDTTYHRWRNESGELKLDQVKRLKEVEAENARLRRAVSDLTLGAKTALQRRPSTLVAGLPTADA